MRDLELSHLIGKARLLRREGKTYDEIRAVIGPYSDDAVRTWLKGIPRPPETNRTGMAKPELRRKVRQLRAEGLTIGEIAEITGASQGSISVWMRDIRVPARVEQRRQAHLQSLRGRGGKARHDRAIAESSERVTRAHHEVGPLTERELLLIGAALYWAEGSKDKPWRRNGAVVLINSDVSVLRVYLAWLALLGVARSALDFRLSIHESADVSTQERWWRDALGLGDAVFKKAILKRHNPKTVRRNVGENYHGCLIIRVARSRALYDAIDGWWRGIADAARADMSAGAP
jgi:transposase-like protein